MSETVCTAFEGERRLAAGALGAVIAAARAALKRQPAASILIFDDATGKVIDLPAPGAEMVPPDGDAGDAEPRGRGRPKLGVIAKEVTLMPQHWEWLAQQPGGASATLRRLVHSARAGALAARDPSVNHAAAYRFMAAMAGNLPRFEEATRALFAGRYDELESQTSGWPEDIRAHAMKLACGASTMPA